MDARADPSTRQLALRPQRLELALLVFVALMTVAQVIRATQTPAPFHLTVAGVLLVVTLVAAAVLLRRSGWLTGTVLVLRDVTGERRVDLSATRVELTGNVLLADSGVGRRTHLIVARDGTPLPTDELRALAEAVRPTSPLAAAGLDDLATGARAPDRPRYRSLLWLLPTIGLANVVVSLAPLLA